MQSMLDATMEIMKRMSMELGGTRSFEDLKPLSPEEKAQKDAAGLNAKRGSEDATDGYVCDQCLNRGYIYIANGKYVTRRDCDCWKARQSIRRMQKSGLGKVIQKYTFQRYIAETDWQKRIKEAAQAFLQDASAKWFFIGGQSGCGKSHICTAICQSLLAAHEVHYMMWEEESVELKSMVTDVENYQNRMLRLKNVDVLYIDDFFSGKKERDGKTSAPSFADVRLAREILNHRYVNGKTTIISTEWYSKEIVDIDTALGSRIIEMCGKYCLNIGRANEKNHRLQMGADDALTKKHGKEA